MRIIETQVFLFNELSDDAKQKAREWFISVNDYDFSEARNSLESFCNHFHVKIKDYSLGAWGHSYIQTDAENLHFRGLKLKSINPDFMPTGYFLDYDLWNTFHSVFKETGNALRAFNDAIEAFIKSVVSDIESQYENDYVDENIEINEYEFTIDGKRA